MIRHMRGSQQMPGLSTEVKTYRYALLRELMRELGCDAFVFTSPDWFEWASNHPVREQSWERPYALVITRDNRSLAFMSEHSRNTVDAERRDGRLWIDEVVIYGETPHASGRGWTTPHWSRMVAEVLRRAGLHHAHLGADALTEPLRTATDLMPQLRIEAIGKKMRQMRWIKHEEEIATMRKAAGLCDWAAGIYLEELRTGRLLAEVDYTVAARLAAEAARRLPGESFSIVSLNTVCGESSACIKGGSGGIERVLERDTVAITSMATRLNGLAMEMGRAWLVGRPNGQITKLFGCTLAMHEAAIDVAVAGNPVSRIHAVAQEIADSHGVGAFLTMRGAHGIGVVQHDLPEDAPFNDRLLFQREVYAIEPSLWVPGVGGFRSADTVVIRNGAAECLTCAPRDIEHQRLQ